MIVFARDCAGFVVCDPSGSDHSGCESVDLALVGNHRCLFRISPYSSPHFALAVGLVVSITDLILHRDNNVSQFLVIDITSVDGRVLLVVIGVTNTGVAGEKRAAAGNVRRHTDNS